MATAASSLPTTTDPMPRPIHRPDTPARWHAAARRARDKRVSVRQVVGTGQWVASSTTDPTVAYGVTPHDCECAAGRAADPVCLHRALLRVLLGMLTLPPDPEPEPPAVIVPIRQPEQPCADCGGEGWWYGSSRNCAHTVITCATCRGTGVDPTTLIAA